MYPYGVTLPRQGYAGGAPDPFREHLLRVHPTPQRALGCAWTRTVRNAAARSLDADGEESRR